MYPSSCHYVPVDWRKSKINFWRIFDSQHTPPGQNYSSAKSMKVADWLHNIKI
jgi:hypothetical protein